METVFVLVLTLFNATEAVESSHLLDSDLSGSDCVAEASIVHNALVAAGQKDFIVSCNVLH